MSPAVKTPTLAPDGFYHPENEAQLKALVMLANRRGVQLRVRGSTHSVSHAIYTDPLGGVSNRVGLETAPEGAGINVMLNLYRGVRVLDRANRIVEVDAGTHLGPDPSDPTGEADFKTSVLGQISKRRWMLSNLGGITHQTISGFTATGSSGGSVQHSLNDNLIAFRYIDAKGRIHTVERDGAGDEFLALCPNLGLLGVVSTVTLRCEPAFNITGQEAISTVKDCAIDLFGNGKPGKPSLERFLREAEYARIEWWPQRNAERVQVWQAQRIRPQPGFIPTRYQQFSAQPEPVETLISIVYTILGNLGDLRLAKPQLEVALRDREALELCAVAYPMPRFMGETFGSFIVTLLQLGVDAAIAQLQPFAAAMQAHLATIFPELLGFFIPLDTLKTGDEMGEPQSFRDWGWRGLPMDNEASDTLLPTGFTELWLPLRRAGDAMRLLKGYFDSAETDAIAYERTGVFGWELYAAKPNDFWLNASHSDGDDEWRDGVLRIDPFWFSANPGDPTLTFYPQLWDLFKKSDIPFRLHWGKYQPLCSEQDPAWSEYFSAQYPNWEKFLQLRRERDPKGIFLTSYWISRLGLWSEPIART